MPVVFETWLEVASLKDSDVAKSETKPMIKGRPLGLASGTFRSRRGTL